MNQVCDFWIPLRQSEGLLCAGNPIPLGNFTIGSCAELGQNGNFSTNQKKKKGGTHCLTAIENYGFYLVKTFCSNFFFLSPLRKISKFWNENFILDTSEALPLWIMWGIYSVMQEQIWNEKLPQDKNWKSFVPEMLISLQPLWLWNVYIFLTTISAKSMWVLKSWNWIETVIYVGKF